MKTKTRYTNFDGLCALLVALSVMAFVTIGIFEMRIDYGSLMGIVFGVVMPKIMRRLNARPRAREACRDCGLGLTEKEMIEEIVKSQKEIKQ